MDGVDAIERDDVDERLAHEPGESGLPFGAPDCLRERTGRDRDAIAHLVGPSDERNDATVVAIERDQRAGVEDDAAHAA